MSLKATATERNAILLATICFASGCASNQPTLDPSPVSVTPENCASTGSYGSPADQQANYKIQPGDDLSIAFYLNPEFDTETTVRPDGKISLRLVGEVDARGLTPAQLSASLNELYSSELVQPGVSVTVKSSPSRVVYVQGQVEHPGAVPLQPRMTALGAIAQAGGLSDGANPDAIVLIRRDACGQPRGQELKVQGVLKQTSANNQEDAELLPGDLVVVPRSTIANIGLFVKQYLKDLIPVSPYLPLP